MSGNNNLDLKLNGLILVGGKSSRMGVDKSTLAPQGQKVIYKLYDILKHFCNEVYFSCRASQEQEHHLEGYLKIKDSQENLGPMGGVISALELKSDFAWFVLACDLPNIKALTIERLVKAWQEIIVSNSAVKALSYWNYERNHAEPLCAIYSSRIVDDIKDSLENKKYCLAGLLGKTQGVKFIDLEDTEELSNTNTPEEYLAVTGQNIKEL